MISVVGCLGIVSISGVGWRWISWAGFFFSGLSKSSKSSSVMCGCKNRSKDMSKSFHGWGLLHLDRVK